MPMDQIALIAFGLCVIAVGVGNFFGSTSRFVIYANIVQELDDDTRKKYQRLISPSYVLIGLTVTVLAMLLPRLQGTSNASVAAVVLIPIFIGAAAWIFVCNKKYLGRFVVPKFKRR